MSLEHEQTDTVTEEPSRKRTPVQDFWTLRERLIEMGITEDNIYRHLPSDPEHFANNT